MWFFTSIFCWIFWFCIVNALSEGLVKIELRHINLPHFPLRVILNSFFHCWCFHNKHWREHLLSSYSRSARGHKDEWEADPVLTRSTRDGRVEPWTDSCDMLKGAGGVVVTRRRDESWRKWLLVNSGRECHETKVLQAKEGKTMQCLKPFNLSKHIKEEISLCIWTSTHQLYSISDI